ncbi:MAG: DUF885 domain-containing protein [Roseburia sp.]|nr:DUF885 domain-containing protein [Roseburia sp.]
MKPLLSRRTIEKFFLSVVLCTTLLFCGSCKLPGSSGHNTSPISFKDFLNELFCREIAENTINLHFTLAHPANAGITVYEVTLGDISEKSLADGNARIENYLQTMKRFSKDAFSPEQKLTYDVLVDYFTLQLDMAPFSLYDEPLTPSGGVHAQLPMLFEEYTFYDEGDIQDYLQLLSQVDDYFAQIVDFEKRKAAAGLFMPDYSCESVIAQCKDFVASADEHFLIETFNKRIETFDGLSAEEREAYIYQNEQLVTIDLVAAYQYLATEMSTLLGSGTNAQGLCYFPDGKEYYTYLVYYCTGCDDNIPEIQETIRKQREADLYAAAQVISETEDFWRKYEAASLSAKAPAATLEELQADMLSNFPAAPYTTYTVDLIDECIADYVAPAYYITAPIDDYTMNSIHISGDYDTTSIDYFTTLAHEGFPGHLYQTVMSYEAGLSPARQLVNCGGYIEGWATYVEMLSYKYADIDPTVAYVMQKDQSALLSLYASTDLGIHYDGWSYADTLEFWNSYGIENAEVVKQIYEYIVGEPGNYLQYYVGYLGFLELKEMAKEKYGSTFDEVAFHQALLDIGPAPFHLIEEYFDEFYEPCATAPD